MPRVCTICSHPQRVDIDRALVAEGAVYRTIADAFSVSQTSLKRHAAAHVPAKLAKAVEGQQAQEAVDLLAQLRTAIAQVNLLRDACDRWLRDPDDPSRYEVGPRAEDVQVVYALPNGNGKPERKKERLSAILRRMEGKGYQVELVETKHADPRELLLRALGRLDGHLTLVARLVGELDERAQINIVGSEQWIAIRSTLTDALAPFPEARIAVADRLAALEQPEGSRHE